MTLVIHGTTNSTLRKRVCMSACARLRNYSHEECRGGMVVENGSVVWSRGTVFREEAGEIWRRRVDGG